MFFRADKPCWWETLWCSYQSENQNRWVAVIVMSVITCCLVRDVFLSFPLRLHAETSEEMNRSIFKAETTLTDKEEPAQLVKALFGNVWYSKYMANSYGTHTVQKPVCFFLEGRKDILLRHTEYDWQITRVKNRKARWMQYNWCGTLMLHCMVEEKLYVRMCKWR